MSLGVLRQRLEQRSEAGARPCWTGPATAFKALVTNLSGSVDALNFWRHYKGRAYLENRN